MEHVISPFACQNLQEILRKDLELVELVVNFQNIGRSSGGGALPHTWCGV